MNKNHMVIGVLGVLVLVVVGMLGAEAFNNISKKSAVAPAAQEQAQPGQAEPGKAQPEEAKPEKPRDNGQVLVG